MFDCYVSKNVTKYTWVCGSLYISTENWAEKISSIAGLQEELAAIQNNETPN
jgi:hypothetical protein